ncbi:MAG TPA: NAD(P)H-dependent oxidoreductase, partial [Elusimicrobiota bacterium]|nr:NAD(P)H-dependent oxidoreductase [Elusimicrobiota bacterium]
IVFGTPVYWYGPTGLMKLFIDRLVYFNCPPNRKKIKGKPAVLVMPLEETNPETAAGTVDFFEKCLSYLEMEFFGKVVAGGVGRKGDALTKIGPLDAARKLGGRLAERLAHGRRPK